MKKLAKLAAWILPLSLASLLLAAPMSASAAETAKQTYTLEYVEEAKEGDTVKLALKVSGLTGTENATLSGYQVMLEYDPELVYFESFTTESGWETRAKPLEDGKLRIVADDRNAPSLTLTQDAVLGYVTFSVTDESECPIYLTVEDACNTDAVAYAATALGAVNGGINVNGPPKDNTVDDGNKKPPQTGVWVATGSAAVLAVSGTIAVLTLKKRRSGAGKTAV